MSTEHDIPNMEMEDTTKKIPELAHVLAYPSAYDVEEVNVAIRFFIDNGLTLENPTEEHGRRVTYRRKSGDSFIVAECDF